VGGSKAKDVALAEKENAGLANRKVRDAPAGRRGGGRKRPAEGGGQLTRGPGGWGTGGKARGGEVGARARASRSSDRHRKEWGSPVGPMAEPERGAPAGREAQLAGPRNRVHEWWRIACIWSPSWRSAKAVKCQREGAARSVSISGNGRARWEWPRTARRTRRTGEK